MSHPSRICKSPNLAHLAAIRLKTHKDALFPEGAFAKRLIHRLHRLVYGICVLDAASAGCHVRKCFWQCDALSVGVCNLNVYWTRRGRICRHYRINARICLRTHQRIDTTKLDRGSSKVGSCYHDLCGSRPRTRYHRRHGRCRFR